MHWGHPRAPLPTGQSTITHADGQLCFWSREGTSGNEVSGCSPGTEHSCFPSSHSKWLCQKEMQQFPLCLRTQNNLLLLPQQTSIQHQQAKGHKAAAAAEETSRHRTAAHPALLSNCSQLTSTKGPFSEAVAALGVVNSKAARQPEPWSQPVHIFCGPISLLLTDHLFQTMQHQGLVSCSAPELTSLL